MYPCVVVERGPVLFVRLSQCFLSSALRLPPRCQFSTTHFPYPASPLSVPPMQKMSQIAPPYAPEQWTSGFRRSLSTTTITAIEISAPTPLNPIRSLTSLSHNSQQPDEEKIPAFYSTQSVSSAIPRHAPPPPAVFTASSSTLATSAPTPQPATSLPQTPRSPSSRRL